MKKVLLTAVVAFSTLVASAQFMVVTTYDGDQEESADKITANLGVGYMINDAFTVGLAKGDAVETITGTDTTSADGYNLWARYNLPMVEGAYVAFEMPTKDGSDNMKIGLGFSFNVWKGLHVEPSYMMSTNKDAEEDGSFNLGIGYRF